MVKVSNISKAFRKETVLKDISFSVEKGQTVCIIGQNGSGKSTLFSILAGHLTPDYGSVTLGTKDERASVGFVPQQDHLFFDLSVKDNVYFWAAAAGLSFASPQVEMYMELFNITSFLSKKVSTLSGGMKKRVALCTALLHNPDILLLDEPFSGLDILHKEEICSYLKKLGSNGKTILYSTHNTGEIHLLADELYVIYNGNIYRVGRLDSLTDINATVTQYLKGAFTNE